MPLFLTILLLLVLLVVCAYLVLIVLMQRASSNSGMGAALGGGAAESALGGGASNVLTKGTIIGSVFFFVLCFALYLGFVSNYTTNPNVKQDVQLLQSAQRDAEASAAQRQQEQAAAEAAKQAESKSLVEIPAEIRDAIQSDAAPQAPEAPAAR